MVSAIFRTLAATAGLLIAASAWAGEEAAKKQAHDPGQQVFARVNGKVVTEQQFQGAFIVAARQKFYHGKPPEAELAKLQRDVADFLINRILLVEEAERRGIKPKMDQVEAKIAGLDQRYGASPQWQHNREAALAEIRPRLIEESMLNQLEVSVREVAEPDEKTVRQYYESHKELFTEPEQVKISVILLRVDPSSTSEAWEAAKAEGTKLVERIRAGEKFEELAKLHSGDPSAAEGGNLGYQHRGMLGEGVEEAIDKLKVGEMTAEPVRILEGYAIFRLDERKLQRLQPFDAVRERAAALWVRDERDRRWVTFTADLRKRATVELDESRFAPVAEAPPKEKH